MSKTQILFVCHANSVRSQIAEGFAREIAGDNIEILSAGIMPIGVSPDAINTMAEEGIDISEQSSDFLSRKLIEESDILVTLCDTAQDKLPYLPKSIKHIHWSVANPDGNCSGEAERRKNYEEIREEIKSRVENLIQAVEEGEI